MGKANSARVFIKMKKILCKHIPADNGVRAPLTYEKNCKRKKRVGHTSRSDMGPFLKRIVKDPVQ